ncbi:MAG: DEAD/DEAH box helicase [Deltaproteobacteria bacterium]|nr:DEAD/DEAH box helicase [Deltaproteobacteria bacterium]
MQVPALPATFESGKRAKVCVSDISAFLRAIRDEHALRSALCHHRTLPAQPPTYAPALPAGFEGLAPVLAARDIAQLYSHQARAIDLLEPEPAADGAAPHGCNVVLATPTASGKTLVYNLPVLRRTLADPEARALYLFPLKALGQDQRQRFEEDARALGLPGARIRAAIYDGDTPTAMRKKLRDDPPNVLITTPDMLHAGILPHHATWKHFFQGLSLVVVDELHSYRGIFGAHVAQVLRRLDRVARFHGAAPQVVAASATIANPGELASVLANREFEVVQADGAPRARREVLLFRPEASPYTLAASLFRLAVGLGLRTIAFTKARVVTELMHQWIVEADPTLAKKISSYRAGFLPEERREIEARLFSGDLMGVISTSALEMGIDVGGLDVCLLVGYPGSQVSTWQRSGRVGRKGAAAIALIAQPDALDQYLISHPEVFFSRGYEHAVLDPHNREIASAHLPCAAAEVPLRAGERWLEAEEARATVAALEESGDLLRSDSGGEWFAARRRPHRDVSLRQIGASYAIALDGERSQRPEVIGSIGSGNVFSECHEGAIYLHRGRQYLVTELDPENRNVWVRAVDAPYYTRAISQKETSILTRDRSRPMGNCQVVQGRLKVTTTITGYERRRVRGQDLLGTEPLELPPTSFETVGIWFEFPDEIPRAVEAAELHVMGGIHACEHAALSLFPLFALCDRHDVAGISYVRHPELKRAAFFLYDGIPGGVGIAAGLFERTESLLDTTLQMIADCECEEGCPACVHSPKCGSGNRPIDKAAAVQTLRLLLARDPLPVIDVETEIDAADETAARVEAGPEAAAAAPRVLYFDLETQRSAAEVGGWHNAHLMRVALAVVYDSHTQQFETFHEADVARLIERLAQADLVVGFNVNRFDYQVLRGYTERNLEALPTFDMLDAIHQRLGFRLPLAHLGEETLGHGKSADGLQSLEWWKQGRVDLIEEYCRDDVALLRDLLGYAETHGHLRFRTRNGERVRLPAPWKIPELLEEVRAGRGPTSSDRRRPRRKAGPKRTSYAGPLFDGNQTTR